MRRRMSSLGREGTAGRLGQRGSGSRSIQREKRFPRRFFGGARDLTGGFLGSPSGAAEFELNKKGDISIPFFSRAPMVSKRAVKPAERSLPKGYPRYDFWIPSGRSRTCYPGDAPSDGRRGFREDARAQTSIRPTGRRKGIATRDAHLFRGRRVGRTRPRGRLRRRLRDVPSRC